MRKCITDPDAVIETNQSEVQPNLNVPEHPIKILDQAEKTLRRKSIPVVKVLWSGQTERKATWETEDSIKKCYPELFA